MRVCPKCAELYPTDTTRCTRDGSELREVTDPLIGRTIGGRYRLISRLGSGGMSSVYLARHVLIDRLMAIKMLRRDLAQDPVQRDRFLREARAVNRINHENIVEITDVGETDEGSVYLVMEYVAGESLLKALMHGAFPALRALYIAEQIAGALARAHQMGVIHRDLKPENVLLIRRKGRADFVKVLDFGIAKLTDQPSLTASQQIFGTPGYIAPEYIQSALIDGRADLYSLGVILYEMVTGALPFDYEYPGDLLVKHVVDPPIPPRERNPDVDPAVEAFVLRCLQKDPGKRFRDGFHMIAEIEKLRAHLGTPQSWGGLNEVLEPSMLPPPSEPAAPPVLRASADAARVNPFEGTMAGVGDVPTDLAKTVPRSSSLPVPAEAHANASHAGSPGRPKSVLPPPPHVAELAVPEAMLEEPSRASAPQIRAHAGLLGVIQFRRRLDAVRAALGTVPPGVLVPGDVAEAVARASSLLDELEQGARDAERKQERAEQLSSKVREVRQGLGERIESVARKLSTHRGELERLTRRADELARERQRREQGGASPKDLEQLTWELAAVDLEGQAERTRISQLETEAETLAKDLEQRSEAIERELAMLGHDLDAMMVDLEPKAHSLRAPLELAAAFVDEHIEGPTEV